MLKVKTYACRWARRAILPLSLTIGSLCMGTIATYAKFTQDQSFKGEIYEPYVPEMRPIIETKNTLVSLEKSISRESSVSDNTIVTLLNELNRLSQLIDRDAYLLNNDEFDAAINLGLQISQGYHPQDFGDRFWLHVVAQIRTAEILSASLSKEKARDPQHISAYIQFIEAVSSQDYARFSESRQALKYLGLPNDDPPNYFFQVFINNVLESHIVSRFEVWEKEKTQLQATRETVSRRSTGKKIGTSKSRALGYFLEKYSHGFWCQEKKEATQGYYSQLQAGPISIDIEHLAAITTIRKKLKTDVPYFVESCRAHHCPPTILASIATYEVLFKGRYPAYDVYTGIGMLGEAKPEYLLPLKLIDNKWYGKPLRLLKNVSLQDRFADFISGVIVGASGTTGLMQMRADQDWMLEERNVRAQNLWGGLNIPVEDWSNQRINWYLIFSDKYSIEAAAALWELMITDSKAAQKAGEQASGLPDMTQINSEQWLVDTNYLLADMYGPDLFASLLDQPHQMERGFFPYSETLINPRMYMLPTSWLINKRSFLTMHRIVLQSGLFQDNPRGTFVGISTIGQLDQLKDPLSQSDKYLAAAAQRTLCEISTGEYFPPQYRGRANFILTSSGITCSQ